MTDQFPPDPQANREAWLAAHPDAAPLTPDSAAADVAAQLGAAAPRPGVTDAQLGAQLAAGGAGAAPLPNESVMDQLMAQVAAMAEEIKGMRAERQAERQAQIAALGEPILERYAKGILDKLTAHVAAHPGLGDEHFGRVVRDATALYDQARTAIQAGANDLSPVLQLAAKIERWITKTHPRTKPGGNQHHVDFSSVLYDLEMMLEEADRLAPAAVTSALALA